MSYQSKMRKVIIIGIILIITSVAITAYMFNNHRKIKNTPSLGPGVVNMQMRYKLGDQLNAIKHEKNGYVIYEYPNMFTPQECDALMAYASKKGMSDSDVLDYASASGTAVNNNYRVSKTAWIHDKEHPICSKLAALSEKLTGIPICNQEMTQVAYYQSGGKFNEHYDACSYDDVEYCNKMNNGAGQRRSTLILYLNDTFTGGETEFIDVGITIKPEKGKAILFWNTDEAEVIIPESKHRANPVTSGEKWICTKWSHVLAYPSVGLS